jgi:hypothetical protein
METIKPTKSVAVDFCGASGVIGIKR